MSCVYTVITVDGCELVLGAYQTTGAAKAAMSKKCTPEVTGPFQQRQLELNERWPRFGTRWAEKSSPRDE